jgi:hypothetical protein
MPRRPQPVKTFDGIWTWLYRGVQASIFIGGILWFAFQFYSDVGGLKVDVAGLKTTTRTLAVGQQETHQKLDTLLSQRNP